MCNLTNDVIVENRVHTINYRNSIDDRCDPRVLVDTDGVLLVLDDVVAKE